MSGELAHVPHTNSSWSREEPRRYGFLKAILKKLLIGAVVLTTIRIGLTFLIVRESSDHINLYLKQVLSALESVSP